MVRCQTPGFVMQHGIAEESLEKTASWIEEADAVVVGGAAGMSSAGGPSFYELSPTFLKYFSEFHEKFGVKNLFDGFYHPYPDKETRWAYIARTLQFIAESPVTQAYRDLARILEEKDFFVVTTNQDQLFRRQFGDARVAWIQGDWGWLQCAKPCHDQVYPSEPFREQAIGRIRDCALPSDLVPRCPRCGGLMEPWIRGYTFLEGSLYREQHRKYNAFLEKHLHDRVLFLELGVGAMTPMFIKEPFWNYAHQWPGGALCGRHARPCLRPCGTCRSRAWT